MNNNNTARALVATNVRRLRLTAELSQEQLAAKLGFHRTYVSHVETQSTNITIDNLDRIAQFFNIPTGALFEPR